MKILFLLFAVLVFSTEAAFGETSLTIYNDNFAIVRETMTLKLKAGVNEVRQGGIADYAEPSSVILRDLTGKNAFSVLQQSFHGAALTQDGMLNALQLEFVGEMDIQATPKEERVQAILGNAFDLIAERVRSEFRVDPEDRSARESFQIKLRNHKSEPVEIRVRESLFRWSNWEITAKSDPFVQKDATTIEFNVPVKAGEEKIISYTVLYTKLPRSESAR